jgi:hypothetical protein
VKKVLQRRQAARGKLGWRNPPKVVLGRKGAPFR